MSTSIHHHTTGSSRSGRAAPPISATAVGRRLLQAVAVVLVPGRAADHMVPALHAADAQALLVRADVLDAEHRTARWDDPTTDAVARFQRARHLPCTGVPDHRTADALLATASPGRREAHLAQLPAPRGRRLLRGDRRRGRPAEVSGRLTDPP